MNQTAQQILDLAESLIRSRGYQGFAYREIANAIGIKSASVHYHFPTKGDLVAAVMDRYLRRFEEALCVIDRETDSPAGKFERYLGMYRQEMRQEKTMSLCMMLGSDIEVLPEAVVDSLQGFFKLNIKWIANILQTAWPDLDMPATEKKASYILAALNGSLMGARCLYSAQYFEHAMETLREEMNLPDPAN